MIDYQIHSTALVATILIETKTILNQWSAYLGRHHYFELGTDAQVVASIEDDLENVLKGIRSIKPRYSISSSSFRDVKNYCEMVNQLNETLKFVREVRRSNYGSMRNTQTCLSHLKDCLGKVNQVSNTVHYVSAGYQSQ
jgi:hypothetical protein